MRKFKIILAVLTCCGLLTIIAIAEPMATEPQPTKILTHGDTMGRLRGEVLDLVKFYFNASPMEDIDVAISTLIKELAKKGYSLNSLPDTDTIRIGARRYSLGKYQTAHYFGTPDGNVWLDIVNYSGAEQIRGIIKGQQLHWGHFYPNPNRGRFIFYTLNKKDNAITNVFHSNNQLVNIGVSLPLEVNNYSNLSQSDYQCINTRIDTLYDVTILVVQHLVSEEDLMMMPSLPRETLTATQRVA